MEQQEEEEDAVYSEESLIGSSRYREGKPYHSFSSPFFLRMWLLLTLCVCSERLLYKQLCPPLTE